MERRTFLKAGIGGGAAMMASGTSAGAAAGKDAATPELPPSILASCTNEDHRRRLQSVGFCNNSIRTWMRRHFVADYAPAQACYNLDEYPSREPWAPNDYDEQELDRLRDHGIQIIQVFDEWNDSLRLFGGHKLRATNPEGFRRFVDMVHRRGMKIMAYVSTGFLQRTDPDFRPEWAREGDYLELGYWNMARCSPASPGWRAYLLPHIMHVLDEYGCDGIYNDCGYVTHANKFAKTPTPDEVAAFEEADDFDGALADLLEMLYGEVKRRGGIFKLHVNGADKPLTRGAKVYDYLWVGEGIDNADALRERVKNYDPYLVPCIDYAFATPETIDEAYLHSIPYLQFPVLLAGRPVTGERGMIPGVAYSSNPDDYWMRRSREVWEYRKTHPDGPHMYGMWDAFPPKPEIRPAHARWLKLYRPLAEFGTRAWLEIGDSDLFNEPLPGNVAASAFANRDVYLVLANYGRETVKIATRDAYAPLAEPGAPPSAAFQIPARSLAILKKS
jgi:hypothetical protein